MRLRSLLELKKYKKPDAKDTLGIKRADMPQVKSSDYKEFMQYLENNGARFTTEKDIPAQDLKPVQSEFSDAGIAKQRAKGGARKPIIASSDNYIIDGHHRWLVALNYDETVDIIRVNMPVRELLKLTLEFPKTYYKDIYTEGYKLQLERDPKMYVLHIIDTETGKRTEVRGKSGYESGNYDPSDKLHQLLDKIGKAANISELINGEPVGINPNHPDGERAKKDTTQAFNEETGEEMFAYFQKIHSHEPDNNSDMKKFILSHEWELRNFTPDMFPSEEEFYDYEDPFDRVIDIDPDHHTDLSQPIIVGPKHSDGKYSVIDGNHRAARAKALGKTIKGYFPVKQVSEDSMLGWMKRKYGKSAYAPQYAKAASLLHKILQRKHDETGGKLRHSLGYYAHMLSRQHGKIDWRELEAEYLERYGNELFERELTKPEEKEKERIVKGMKKAKGDFKDRYGDDAEAVMYATATKLAKKNK